MSPGRLRRPQPSTTSTAIDAVTIVDFNDRLPSSLSVTLTLSPSSAPSMRPVSQPVHWLQDRGTNSNLNMSNQQQNMISGVPAIDGHVVSELAVCCRELEERHRAWMPHKKEAAWRLWRVELLLETEKACKKREKMEEIEAKLRASPWSWSIKLMVDSLWML